MTEPARPDRGLVDAESPRVRRIAVIRPYQPHRLLPRPNGGSSRARCLEQRPSQTVGGTPRRAADVYVPLGALRRRWGAGTCSEFRAGRFTSTPQMVRESESLGSERGRPKSTPPDVTCLTLSGLYHTPAGPASRKKSEVMCVT